MKPGHPLSAPSYSGQAWRDALTRLWEQRADEADRAGQRYRHCEPGKRPVARRPERDHWISASCAAIQRRTSSEWV
jgi:hypothetical protein